MPHATRRNFLLTASGTLAALAAADTRAADAPAPPNNVEPLNLAFIGPGGQGTNLLKSFASMKDVRITHVCDVDAKRAAAAAENARSIGGHEPKVQSDLRRVLDDA